MQQKGFSRTEFWMHSPAQARSGAPAPGQARRRVLGAIGAPVRGIAGAFNSPLVPVAAGQSAEVIPTEKEF